VARAAQSQASNAQNTAGNTAANYGAQAQGNYAELNPFLSQELKNPSGYSQQDLTSQLSASQGGAGGATSSLLGQSNLQTARTRNSGGFGTALDAAARSRQQASAGASENIAANNANLKNTQQQSAVSGLTGLYGANTDAAMKALGIQTGDINAETNAGNSGWLQNATSLLNSVGGVAGAAFGKGGMFAPGGRWG
jgi:hypothetical protein